MAQCASVARSFINNVGGYTVRSADLTEPTQYTVDMVDNDHHEVSHKNMEAFQVKSDGAG